MRTKLTPMQKMDIAMILSCFDQTKISYSWIHPIGEPVDSWVNRNQLFYIQYHLKKQTKIVNLYHDFKINKKIKK